jgi:hypothetical protein
MNMLDQMLAASIHILIDEWQAYIIIWVVLVGRGLLSWATEA